MKKQPKIENKTTKFNFKKIILSIILILILLTFTFFYIYVNDYYLADLSIISELNLTNVEKTIDEKDNIIFKAKDSNPTIGFIFYPGGKVDETAYEPLASLCTNSNVTTIITPMPFNLAVFDINAAKYIIDTNPEIKTWYIGGHSLGGSMAGTFASKNLNKINGVILLASYSTSNISNTDVLSIYGSEDSVLNLEKYNNYKSNLPNNLSEFIINGGNHAYFGSYGNQAGDGIAKITNKEQLLQTSTLINNFIENNK